MSSSLLSNFSLDNYWSVSGGLSSNQLMIGKTLTWDEWCSSFLFNNFLPIYVLEPLVILDLSWAVKAKSVRWFTLKKLVDEVSRFHWPVCWQVLLLDLCLLLKNLIPDVFASFADVWSSAQHEFVSYYAQGKVVYCYIVVLTAHNLWCHVPWSARSVVRVVRCPNPGNSQVSNPDIAIVIKKEVLRFDVSVNNPAAMHVFKPHDDTSNEELRLLLIKSLTFILMKPEVATCHKVSDKENVHVVGECVKHINQESTTMKGSLEMSSTYGCFS